MDTLEIMTGIRNTIGLHTEQALPTRVLLRHMNTAYFEYVIPELSDHIKEKVYSEYEYTDEDGDTLAKPANCEKVTAVDRGGYPCIEIPLDQKYKVGQYRKRGTILQFPDDDSEHPFYIDENANIRLYPTLDETDVTIMYNRKICPLLYGRGSLATYYLTMDDNAPVSDDILNDYEIALYKYTGVTVIKRGIYTVSDYAGSTGIALFSELAGDYTYDYALVPIIPERFHPFIQEATLIKLAQTKPQLYAEDWRQLEADFKFNIQDAQNKYVRT